MPENKKGPSHYEDEFKTKYLDTRVSEAQARRKAARDEEKARIQASQKTPEEKKREIKRRRGFVIWVAAVVIALAVSLRVAAGIIALKVEKQDAQEELDALNKEKAQLEEELSEVQSPEYIEQQARSELRMIYPGETLYVIEGDEDEEAESEEGESEGSEEGDAAKPQ